MQGMQIVFWVLVTVIVVAIAAPMLRRKEAIKQFFLDVRVEMGKVAWPSKPEVINSTVLVGVTVLILTIMTGAIDKVFNGVLQLIYS